MTSCVQAGQLKHAFTVQNVFLFLKMFANFISLREFGSPMSIVFFKFNDPIYLFRNFSVNLISSIINSFIS